MRLYKISKRDFTFFACLALLSKILFGFSSLSERFLFAAKSRRGTSFLTIPNKTYLCMAGVCPFVLAAIPAAGIGAVLKPRIFPPYIFIGAEKMVS